MLVREHVSSAVKRTCLLCWLENMSLMLVIENISYVGQRTCLWLENRSLMLVREHVSYVCWLVNKSLKLVREHVSMMVSKNVSYAGQRTYLLCWLMNMFHVIYTTCLLCWILVTQESFYFRRFSIKCWSTEFANKLRKCKNRAFQSCRHRTVG